MKRLILIAPALIIFALTSNAQTKTVAAGKTVTPVKGASTAAVIPPTRVDKTINRATNAVNSANNSVNNAGVAAKNAINAAQNSANQVKGVTNKMDSLLGPKTNAAKPAAITIKVPGANRAKLKELTAAIKTIDGINSKDVDYDDSAQTISIAAYKGKLNDLLDEIEKKAPQVTDNNATTSKATNTITITGL